MENYSPFWSNLLTKKGGQLARIAFTDGTDPRIIEAARRLQEKNLIHPVLITPEQHPGVDTLNVGIDLLKEGKVDGMVAGSLRPTADVIKATIHNLGTKPGHRLVSGHFFIESSHLKSAENTPFLFADCAVVPEPSAMALATIARSAADSYRFFTGKTPRVALLSFSTRGSAEHPLVNRIRETLEIIRKQDKTLIIDGEIQADAALDAAVARIKNAADSPLGGQANVFIFPTLEAGNIGYKLVQRFSQARVAGPLLWGLSKPVSDLSRGCTVEEVTDTAMCVSAMVTGKN